MQNPHNEIHADVTGVMLAGGESRRMGRDKSLIDFLGSPLHSRVRRALAHCCAQVFIAGDRPDLAAADCPAHADRFPGSALGGLQTALSMAGTDWVCVLPCDLPYPSPRLLQSLLALRGEAQAVVPRHPQGVEPLIACYRRDCLPLVEAQLASGRYRIDRLFQQLRVRFVEPDELPAGWRRAIRNLNTPDDLEGLLRPPPAVTVVARSGTGKTTLLEKLVAEMVRRGWTIGTLKHDAHRFEIDHEGKDTWRMTQAGAAVTAICSASKQAVVRQHELEPTVEELIARELRGVDLVLTEGFKQSLLPKIEVHRQSLGMPLLCRGERVDPALVAVASDAPLELDVPLFDLDQPAPLADFLERRYLS